jgi:DNA-binding MarR family transcriptional regulator
MHALKCEKKTSNLGMDPFLEIAETVIIYHIKTAWLEIGKVYNNVAGRHGLTLAMGFTLLAISEERGTLVTRIAPRIGMEPNSLSRILNSLEEKGAIYRKRDEIDKRRVYVFLTPKGSELRNVALRMVFRLNEVILEDVGKENLENFFEVMRRIPKSVNRFREIIEEEHLDDIPD